MAALSLYRVADELSLVQKDADTHFMILQWNPGDLSITVFNQERPTFNRHAQNEVMGNSFEHMQKGEWVWQESEAELEMQLEEQLNNLERFLDFYRYSVLDGEGRISEIILTGAYPNLEELKNQITERFLLNVKLLELSHQLDPAYSALYGLTLRDEKGKNKKKRGSER